MARLPALVGAGLPLRPPSLKALKWFWVAVLLGFAGSGATLAWLGPPVKLAPGTGPRVERALETMPNAAPEAAAPTPAGQAAAGSARSTTAGTATTPGETARPAGAAAPIAAPPGLAPAAPPVVAAVPVPEPPASPPPAANAERAIPRAEPAMLEVGAYGPLPKIGADGRTPMRVYARPFDRNDLRPRVALVLGGLGMNAALTDEAIRRLPPTVTLAFSPYATQVALLLDRARGRGMESLVALPLEPTGYPLNSPGDRALLTGLSSAENSERLDWALSRFTGFVGAIGALGPMRGERYAAMGDRLGSLQETLQRRGLMYVDPRPGATTPARAWGVAADVVVDDPPGRLSIDRKLGVLEGIARERGTALGYAGEATPVLLDRLAAWAGSLESRGSVLVPVSVLMRRPDATADRR
jgi:polysaccharide deacetylase 2 family uncharacterized protein YibQ